MMMRRQCLLFAAACAALLAPAARGRRRSRACSCSSRPRRPRSAKTQPGSLRIGTVTVAAPYRGKQFVVRETDLKYETDYYNEFLVAPAANVREAAARALGAAKVWSAVVPSTVTIDTDWVLDAFVDALYGDARGGQAAAVFSATFFLRRNTGEYGVPVWSKTYERRVPFASGSASAYVAALNTAFGDVLAELARDLSSQNLPK